MKIKIKDLVGDLTYEELRKEKWKTPKLFVKDGRKFVFKNYAISKNGIIIRIIGTNFINSYPGKLIHQHIHSGGYKVVGLRIRKGKRITRIKVHRLLWETWRGRIPGNLELNHKDTIKTNNNLRNLEIITHKENAQHAIKKGLYLTEEHRKNVGKANKERIWKRSSRDKLSKSKKGVPIHTEESRKKIGATHLGEKNHRAILTEKKAKEMRYFSYIKKLSQAKIAKMFHVSLGCVQHVIEGNTWNKEKLTREKLESQFY